MFLFIFLLELFACDGGLNPKNIELSQHLMNSSMTEELFKSTIEHFEKKLGPWVEDEFFKELVIFKSWNSNTINAFADQDERKMMITIYGGIARYESMTEDSLSLVLCHELGHHLGGAPKKTAIRWSSAEGQADYYATMKCLKHLWEKEEKKVEVPELVKTECQKIYPKSQEQILCHRISKASHEVSLLFQYLDRDSIPPDFSTPDVSRVNSTQLMHPYAQCRLDTYFQGVLCKRDPRELMDDVREDVGVCQKKQGDLVGLRPSCWFKE